MVEKRGTGWMLLRYSTRTVNVGHSHALPPYLYKKKMGTYIYLSCMTCNEYIHIGKTGGSDFEVSYDLLKRFLTKHSIHHRCVLATLNDSFEGFEYDYAMQGKEFK